MNAAQGPVVSLTITRPRNLNDVVKWAQLAEGLSFPGTSTVDLNVGGTTLTVSAYLGQTEPPVVEE